MEVLTGQPVSPGYAHGVAIVYADDRDVEIPRYSIDERGADAEIARFHEALERSRDEVKQLERRVLADLGEEYASIFSAHLALLEDRQFAEQVERRVRDQRVNVEQAVQAQVDELAGLLSSVDNEYFRQRAHDIHDLGNRVLRQLLRGQSSQHTTLPPDSVIVARQLLPSETVGLDRAHVAGIVTEEGGENSHAAILARGLGIPAVTGVADATSRIPQGCRLWIDGSGGRVTVSPTTAAATQMAALKHAYDAASAAATVSERLECVTSDGVHITLLANLNRADEVSQVAAHHLDGVGLFRTEFLYMDSATPPSYERQLDVYGRLLERLDGKPLVVRTLDLGGDKLPMFIAPHHEENPTLGLRGLRFSLSRPDLFDPQLRALLSASRPGNLQILFPMVLGESDLAEAIERVRRFADEMKLDKLPRLGAMIETPAALFSLKEILEQVDFLSVGTNDLTQFMLAVDRNAAELVDEYSVLHPSVLRGIRQVVLGCDEKGCELSICGESAGDAATACLFVGLGVRRLSMSPVRAARVRAGIRQSNVRELAELAEQSLLAGSASDVKARLHERWGHDLSTLAHG